ncbi:MAG: hypothetical protein ACRELA_03080 [Candidatus Rokuibacteriota bacterium]
MKLVRYGRPTRDHFRLVATLDAFEGDARVFSQSWDRAIPRDVV